LNQPTVATNLVPKKTTTMLPGSFNTDQSSFFPTSVEEDTPGKRDPFSHNVHVNQDALPTQVRGPVLSHGLAHHPILSGLPTLPMERQTTFRDRQEAIHMAEVEELKAKARGDREEHETEMVSWREVEARQAVESSYVSRHGLLVSTRNLLREWRPGSLTQG
jgi:hypothetical protein